MYLAKVYVVLLAYLGRLLCHESKFTTDPGFNPGTLAGFVILTVCCTCLTACRELILTKFKDYSRKQ